MLMDKEIVENIEKVSFLSEKLKKVEMLLKSLNYENAYKATAALIEIVCIIGLEKIYNEKVEDSNIINLISIFDKHNEKEIKDILIDINGEYNSIKFDEIGEIDILALLGNLDDLVKNIIEKYGNIF